MDGRAVTNGRPAPVPAFPIVLPASALQDLKELLGGFPGEAEVVIELLTSGGTRQLRLGTEFRVGQSAGLHAELDALLGGAMIGEGRSTSLAATA